MGRSTWSDIVKNVAYIGNNEEIDTAISELGEDIYDWEFTKQKKGDKPTKELNGWSIVSTEDKIVNSGKKKSLYADRFRKGDQEVFVLNTSEYASVGEHDYVVYADDEAAVREFLNDFGLKIKIASVDSVCQTM